MGKEIKYETIMWSYSTNLIDLAKLCDLSFSGKDLIHCVLGLSMASDSDEDLVRTNLAGYIVM